MLELINQCELKLQQLQEEVQGKDVAAVTRGMDKEEFLIKTEEKLLACKTRVKQTVDKTLKKLRKEKDSEEDDAGVILQEELKRQSQLVAQSMSKKKLFKRKSLNF